jgi:hypothetical protein
MEGDPPRFYIAASYPRKEEARKVALGLQEYGLRCTSQWLHRDEGYGKDGDERMKKSAELDLADIKIAHFLIELSGDKLSHGGRHCEVGIALGMYKPVFILGAQEQIFHWLPYVKVCQNMDELTKEVLAWSSQPTSW